MKQRPWAKFITTACLTALPGLGNAGEVSTDRADLHGAWSSLWVENDLVVQTDRHYTAGTKLTALMPERSADESAVEVSTAKWLPDFGLKTTAVRWGVGLAQDIYTPSNTQLTSPQLNDRPYAGYLYSTWYLQKRGTTASGNEELDQWSVDLGVVGPPSQAEEAQNTVHRLRSFPIALGWGSQIHSEPAVNLRYIRTLRYAIGEEHHIQADFLPQYGATAGTTYDYLQVGAMARLGWNLAHDFGRRTIQDGMPGAGGRSENDGHGFSFYVLAGFEGRAVAHNTLLDGNLFRDSQSVSKYICVGDAKAGFGLAWARWELSYIQTLRSKEYIGQPSLDSFGSLSLTYRW